jgi:phenylacetyl-CoA:acceptor oxidoreductase 26-kDa subunit
VKNLVFIDPVWQRVWHWPAVVNLIMGGTAGGFFLSCLIARTTNGPGAGLPENLTLGLAAPLMVCLGFAAVAVEAGKPLSAKYLLHHLRTSWMSREVLVGFLFVLFAVLDAFFEDIFLKSIAAVTAAGLLVSQGMMVYRARAVTAWNRPILPLHFFSSGINLGFGLLLIWAAAVNFTLKPTSIAVGLGILAANLIVWYSYLFKADEVGFRQAARMLRSPGSLTVTVGFGHLIPLLLLIVLLAATFVVPGFQLVKILYLLSGLAILAGGISQKAAIVLNAYMLREVRADDCHE